MVKRIDSNSNKEILFRQIGAKITYYRKAQQLTQEQLAVRVNVSTNTIGRIERGKYNNNISLSLLLDIAVGLGIEAYVLLMFTEEEKRVWHSDD